MKAKDAEHRDARETIEKAEETDTVVTAKDAEHKEARETIEKAEELSTLGTPTRMRSNPPGMMLLWWLMRLILTAQWWRRVCPQPQPSWTEQWDTMGLVGTMLFLSSRAEQNYPQLAAISKFSGNPVFR